ncbi:MAG: hypothetical protein KDD61_07300 [Bdellovibrionales bacterium]|nr:hypothetical protein [Bdellovibrionales bacterium]
MIRFCLIVILIFFSRQSFGKGVSIEAAAGLTSAQITNPDGSIAYYTGISLQPKGHLPIFDDKTWGVYFNLTGRYLTFENNANYSVQRETGTHLGPGFGLSARFARFSMGADYFYLRARHYLAGTVSGFQEFDYQPLSYFISYNKPINNSMSLIFSYNKTTAVISAEKADIKADAQYEDTTLFLHIKIDTGESLGKFLKGIFF